MLVNETFDVHFHEDDAFDMEFYEDGKFGLDFGEVYPISSENAVLYVPQTLTEVQKQQARENIGVSSSGDDKTYVHRQYSASDSWTIVHNLNKFPSVTVVDSANSKVIGEVEYVDENTVNLYFNYPFSGKAYFN